MSAVFSVGLEGLCSIFNWDRGKWFVLGCTTAFMNPLLMRALDRFRALRVCLRLNIHSAHKAISHITSACSMILLEGVCFRSGVAGQHSSLIFIAKFKHIDEVRKSQKTRRCKALLCRVISDYYHYGIKADGSICCSSSLFVHADTLFHTFHKMYVVILIYNYHYYEAFSRKSLKNKMLYFQPGTNFAAIIFPYQISLYALLL